MRDGDINTRFFHQTAFTRKRVNRIHDLFNENNNWVTEQVQIEEVVCDYFTNIFTPTESLTDIADVTAIVRTIITPDDNSFLAKQFEVEKFRIMISQMHKDKSPGPDGFIPGFYKKNLECAG